MHILLFIKNCRLVERIKKAASAHPDIASCSFQRENAAARLEEQCDTFLNTDKIENLINRVVKYLKNFNKNIYGIKLILNLICFTCHHYNLSLLKFQSYQYWS